MSFIEGWVGSGMANTNWLYMTDELANAIIAERQAKMAAGINTNCSPKPRRDCRNCGAPWRPVCDYCGS
jgi:hypothetical protein